MSDWFERVFGFREGAYEETRSRFEVEEDEEGSITLVAKPNEEGESVCGKRFHVGKFDTPSVAELGEMLEAVAAENAENDDPAVGGGLTFRHIVADAGSLHRKVENEGAVFQAASQFNCLEMPGPRVTPDDGVTGYHFDRTQGPACALACPAGTVYRNYFVGGAGQGGRGGRQLDTLADVERALGKTYWKMKNGYALPASGRSISALRADVESGRVDAVKARSELRVGVHWDTEVAPKMPGGKGGGFNVAQVYCSAVPVAYDYTTSRADWEPLARLCLDGSYEATLAVAAILARRNNRRIRAFLTKVGGGAFGNSEGWISDAIKRSLDMFKSEPLDVYLVHYPSSESHYLKEIDPIGVPLFGETFGN